MKIEINTAENVTIKFKGKINMSQEVVLSKKDAKMLGKILTEGKSRKFETD